MRQGYSSILTKAFTGNLLKTYFKRKTLPLVETLQDIYLNKEISIASSSYSFRGFGARLKESQDLKNDLLSRMIDFEEKYHYSDYNLDYFSEYYFRKLINGKIVIMMESQKVQNFKTRWKHEEKYFQVSSYNFGGRILKFL